MSLSPDTAGAAAGDGPSAVRPRITPVAPFLWSIRREVWEHKSLYLAPLSVAGLFLLGALFSTFRFAARARAQVDLSPDATAAVMMAAFGASAMAVILVSGVVGVFYCLAALNGERRDRSILFWKSLPVSDLTAVLAKASVPLVVLPVFVFVLVAALQTVLLVLGGLGLMIDGGGPGLMGADVRLPEMWGLLFYGLVAVTLWYAPIYGWLLMVSAWSKRAPFLWAVLPPLALALVERLTLGTSYIGRLIHERIGGFAVGFQEGSGLRPQAQIVGNPLSIADPAGLFMSPGLWGGLVAAGVLIAATVWLRQNRDPI
jgi:ABC-2 type transport system permease protein